MREIVSPLSGIRSPFGPIIDPHKVAGQRPPFVADFGADQYRVGGAGVALSDALTFARAGNATMVDSDGLLKWAPHNLLPYSEQFDNAAWLVDGISVSDHDSHFILTATKNAAKIEQLVVGFDGPSRTFAVDVKSNTGSDVSGTINISGAASQSFTAGLEWQTIETEWVVTSVGSYRPRISIDTDGDSIQVRNAHLYRSDLGGMVKNPDRGDSYVPTTSSAVYLPRRGHHVYNGTAWVNEGLLLESEARTNLVTYSEQFDNAAWIKLFGGTGSAPVVTANHAISPSGEATADRIVFSAGAGTSGSDFSVVTFQTSLTSGTTYAQGIWLSATSGTQRVYVYTSGAAFSNVISGEVVELTAGEWTKVTQTRTATATGNGNTLSIGLFGTDGIAETTADILVWGAQLEAGSTPSSYIPTSGATVTRAAETLTIPSAKLPWPTPNVIGPELVTNGTFDTDTDWTKGTGWTISGGVASFTTTGAGANLGQVIATEVGKVYEISCDLLSTDTALNYFYVSAILPSQVSPELGATLGRKSFVFVATATTTTVGLRGSSLSTATFDNISVREIDPLAVSIQMQGRMTYADEDTLINVRFFQWDAAATGTYITSFLNTSGSGVNQVRFYQDNLGTLDVVSGPTSSYSPGVFQPYNIASRHGSTFVNGSVDGTALTANTTPTSLPDLSATNLQLGHDYMGTIKLLRIWAADLEDTGIAEASA